MGIPNGWELVLIVVVIMLLFGYKKLPDATRSIGRSLRIFKAETKGLREDETPSSSTPEAIAPPVTSAGLPPTVPPTATPVPPADLASSPPVNEPQAGSEPR